MLVFPITFNTTGQAPPFVPRDYQAWEFDNSLVELTGSGNDLSAIGSWSPTYVTGKINQAAQFNVGGTYYARREDVGWVVPFNLDFNKSWAISFWWRNSNASELSYFGVAPTANNTAVSSMVWAVRISLTQVQFFYTREEAAGTESISQSFSSIGGDIPVDTWAFIWLIHDIATPQTVLLGKNDQHGSNSSIYTVKLPTPQSTYSFQIAGNVSTNDRQLDQLALWDRVMTPADMIQLWNNGDGLPLDEFGLYPSYFAWRFNDTLTDESGAYTWNELTTYTAAYVDGKPTGTNAVNLKTTPYYRMNVAVPDAAPFSLSGGKDWTITAWTLRKSNRDLLFYMRADSASATTYIWQCTMGEFSIRFDPGNYNFNDTTTDDTWYLRSFRYNATTNELTFGNNTTYNTLSSVNLSGISYPADTSTLHLMLATINSAGDHYLDQLVIWDGLLTDEQIESLYNAGSGVDLTTINAKTRFEQTVLQDSPLLYYSFQPVSGTNTTQLINHTTGVHATLTVAGTNTDGLYRKSAGSLFFDSGGTGSSYGYTDSEVTAVANGFSYELIFQTDQTDVALAGRAKGQTSDGGSLDAELTINLNGYLQFYSFDTSGWTTIWNINVADNQPHHVVLVQDVLDLKLYLDGTLRTASSGPTNRDSYASYSSGTAFIGVGRSFQGGLTEFLGRLDEFVYYTTALTQTQVQTHYAALSTAIAQV